MSARLHVLLGAGGVGKTTLAAAYALALGRRGSRVGLLGIDPARRLQDALGIELEDQPSLVQGSEQVRAALLSPATSLRRWAAEAASDPVQRQRLLDNAFFVALADRLAGATDVLAAARLAEWAEQDPQLTDLVVDTAPGLNAIEFLRRPQSLVAFLQGRLVSWLRLIARSDAGPLASGARRVVGALARIGGGTLVQELAEFVWLVEATFARMAQRLERAEAWLRDPSTEILLVTAVRDDAVATDRTLVEALAPVGLTPSAVLVNRAVPAALAAELATLDLAALAPECAPLVRYARGYAAMQARVVAGVHALAPRVVAVPHARGLDGDERLRALADLGETLLR